MTSQHLAILDPAAGISGDMLLGALLDAGAAEGWLTALPGRLGFPDVAIEAHRVLRCGIACTKVSIRLPGGESELPSPDYARSQPHHDPHDHGLLHAHHPQDQRGAGPHGRGAHRHLADLLAVVERAPLSGWVRDRAVRAFRLLCQEEGRIHGVPADSVALHEVGAIDAILDIVGGIEGFEQLGIDRVYLRPLSLGNGWVHAAHGIVAVPAPVTLRLVEGLEIGPDGPVVGEATTPTGAVLLRVLGSGSPPSHWRAITTGWGAGGRDPVEYPNALRLVLAESSSEATEVVTLSSDLDDLSPEYLEPVREALMAAGALDVQMWVTMMKKGRPGFRIEAHCSVAEAERVTEALFLHSTTTGVRRATAERVTLQRRQVEVMSPVDGVPISVKVVDAPAGPRVKAEFEDVRRAALRLGRPAAQIAREIEAEARALVGRSPAGSSPSPKEQE